LIFLDQEDKLRRLILKGINMKPLYLSLFFSIALSFTTNTFADNFSQVYQEYLTSQKTDKHQQTLELAKKSVELGKAKFGESDANAVNLTYNLATSYAAAQEFQNAFDTMQIVTSDFETRYGSYSEKLFTALLDQLSYFPRNRYADLDKRDEILSPKADQAIDIAVHLSEQSKEKTPFIYYQLSKIITRHPIIHHVRKEAKKYTELAFEGLLDSVGKNDHRTIETQFTLATIKTGTRKFNRAIELYEDLIINVTSQMQTSHPYELAARGRLVSIYEEKRESEKATQHCIEIGKMTPWEQDINPIPLYRIEPKYPVDYARNDREGWAKMSFTIDEMGFVKDIAILDVEGGKSFGDESIKVLKKWRYAPKFENGQIIAAKGMKVQMDFKLGKNKS
jgi:TonB family protein